MSLLHYSLIELSDKSIHCVMVHGIMYLTAEAIAHSKETSVCLAYAEAHTNKRQ
jgi:hypothetical protein